MLLDGLEVTRENILDDLPEALEERDSIAYRHHQKLHQRLAGTNRPGHEVGEGGLVRLEEIAHPLDRLGNPPGHGLDGLAEQVKDGLQLLHHVLDSVHKRLILLHLLHQRAHHAEDDAEDSDGRILCEGLEASLDALDAPGGELQALAEGVRPLAERLPLRLIVADVALKAVRRLLRLHYLGTYLLDLLLEVVAHLPDAVLAGEAVKLGVQLRELAAEGLQRALVLGHLLDVLLELVGYVVHLLAQRLHRLLLAVYLLAGLALGRGGLLLRHRALLDLLVVLLLLGLKRGDGFLAGVYLLLIVRDALNRLAVVHDDVEDGLFCHFICHCLRIISIYLR